MSPRTAPTRPDTATTTGPPAADSTCLACGVACVGPDTSVRKWSDGSSRIENRDPWAACPACEAVIARHGSDNRDAMVELLGRVLGEELDPHDSAARKAAAELPLAKHQEALTASHAARFPGADGAPMYLYGTRPKGPGNAEPWAHVTDTDRENLRAVLARERRKLRPRRSKHGPCGCCGRLRAMRWTSPRQVSTDPRIPRWPLCGTCVDMLDRAGTTILADARTWITAAAVHSKPMMSKDFLKGYAETMLPGVDPAKCSGAVEPYGYITRQELVAVWERWPKVAPPEWRAKRERIAAAAAAMHAQPSRVGSALSFDPNHPDDTRPGVTTW